MRACGLYPPLAVFSPSLLIVCFVDTMVTCFQYKHQEDKGKENEHVFAEVYQKRAAQLTETWADMHLLQKSPQ